MPAPQATPLLLPSVYNAAVNQDEPLRLLEQIIHASSLLQGACARRFDEYLYAQRYDATPATKGGDLQDGSTLLLDADLRAVTTLYVGIPFGGVVADGTAVTSYSIDGEEFVGGAPTNSGRALLLDPYNGGSFIASTNPHKSIGVTGRWGFGGQWVATGATVRAAYTANGVTLPISNASLLEAGMVLKIGTEYLYCEGVTEAGSSDTATVSGAYNGSTAANHSAADVIYYWEAHPLVQSLIRRLVQWSEEQLKSPMATTVTVADFSFPAATAGLPKDVFDTIYKAGLVALPERIVKE